mmetsp:Transcript_44581/g.80142  ORF Transcript_44581/g.80142 Transcript_44581/m.80142 type:complete len:267 (+) Transcript_44581:35-835(+)
MASICGAALTGCFAGIFFGSAAVQTLRALKLTLPTDVFGMFVGAFSGLCVGVLLGAACSFLRRKDKKRISRMVSLLSESRETVEVQKVLIDNGAKFPHAGLTIEQQEDAVSRPSVESLEGIARQSSNATLPYLPVQEQNPPSQQGTEGLPPGFSCEGRASFIDDAADGSAQSRMSSFVSVRTSLTERLTPRFLADTCRFCGRRPGILGMKGFGLRLRGHERRCAKRRGVTLLDSHQSDSCNNSFVGLCNSQMAADIQPTVIYSPST